MADLDEKIYLLSTSLSSNIIGVAVAKVLSEKQIELNKTLKAEKIALKSIRDEFVSDSTSLFGIVNSIENEQHNIENLLKHISSDTILSDAKLNALIFDMIYFNYLTILMLITGQILGISLGDSSITCPKTLYCVITPN